MTLFPIRWRRRCYWFGHRWDFQSTWAELGLSMQTTNTRYRCARCGERKTETRPL